ncbi:MAG: rhodanese-like domain-containing protein [Gammaproteobacteria bacterium]|nr:MAG: rhodanese-like domain-containing protein [Gammaproteobacteria bacterium]
MRHWLVSALLLAQIGFVGAEDEVKVEAVGDSSFIPLVKDKPYMFVIHDGNSVKVQRVQDPEYQLQGYFAKTARKCPPFCIQPIIPAPGVNVIGEVELFTFLETEIRDKTGIMIDARTPSWYSKATIPGSVNYPFSVLSKDPGDPELEEIIEKFGAVERIDVGFFTQLLERWGLADTTYLTEDWDFRGAKNLVLYCNGPACGQSPRAINGLLATGYPADKLFYYRGGMQMWQLWGLTTVVP